MKHFHNIAASSYTQHADQTGDNTFVGSVVASGGVAGDVVGDVIGDLTGDVTGDVIGDVTGSLTPAAAAAEHGPGVIGTGTQTAPVTTRWTENGIIITQVKFDITGLYVLGTSADEVIALEAGGIGYLGRNVVATNGQIFKAELSCLETPTGSATITGDIDIATAASGTLEKDGDGTSARLINGGTLVVGQTVQNLVPAPTADHYYYIVGADTAATTGTYTAGQYILTTYGNPLLT